MPADSLSDPVEKISTPKASKKTADKPVATNWFKLGYLVHDVARMRRTLYDQHLRPLGITRSQWWVLANISRTAEQGVVSSVLARDLDVGKVTLSGLIERLEIAGYIYRRADKDDKRSKRIFITDAGFKLIETMKEIITPLNQSLCEGLSQQEILQLEDSLAIIKKNLREQLGEDVSDEV